MKEYSKWFIFSLTKDKLLPMMMREVKNETQWVQDVTLAAYNTCPNLTEAQKEDILIREEDVIL